MDERTRHELHQRLDELLGVELAVALMSSLPPRSWDDVATKRDLAESELRIETKLERGLREQTRTLVFAMLGANATFGALVLAAVKLG
jgi:hypothetical protein